mgnify:CR=1 FL=1
MLVKQVNYSNLSLKLGVNLLKAFEVTAITSQARSTKSSLLLLVGASDCGLFVSVDHSKCNIVTNATLAMCAFLFFLISLCVKAKELYKYAYFYMPTG